MPLPQTIGVGRVQPAQTIAYADLVRSIQPVSLFRHWPLWESSGTTAVDQIGGGNATLTSVALGTRGIGDNRTACTFNGTTSVANGFSGNFTTKFSGAEGSISLWMYVNEAAWTDATIRRALIVQVDTNNRVYILRNTPHDQIDFVYVAGSTVKQVQITNVSSFAAGWMHVALTWSKSNDRLISYINGVQRGSTQTGLGTWAGTVGQVTIGAGAGTPTQQWSGGLAHIALWSIELTAVEVATLANGVPHWNAVIESDSRGAGTGATSLQVSYPRTGVRKLPLIPWRVANISTGGETVQTMASQLDSQLAPLYDPTAAKNIAILFGGVNDGGTQPAATIVGYINQWHAGARQRGWTTYACTEIDAQDAARNSNNWHTVQWPAINAAIAAAYPASQIIDFGADSRFQDATNTGIYNVDQIHEIDAGHLALGEIMAAKIAATL